METLLRPAKQLAEWDSCFAQDLEKYSNLLKESQGVNFGEGALIIQNSANVYARRVEYLWDETEALNQSLSIHNEEKSSEKATAKEKKGRKPKSVIDFNDFESLDLDSLIGKSNNLKEGAQKNLKLLTRRFTQLESNLAQLSTPIEILSTEGEVIGNKYDFRCNQQLTKYCMLVDELTPNDFLVAPIAATSNHETLTVPAQNQDTSFDSMFEPIQSVASPGSIASEDGMDTDVSPCANENLGKSSTHIPDETDAGYTSGDPAEDPVQSPQTSCLRMEQICATEAQSDATKKSPEAEADARSSITDAETSAIAEPPTQITDSDKDKDVLEPIPFEQVVRDKVLPRRRAAFKLPCHVSLLKTNAGTRKRKGISDAKKREYLTRFLLDKYDHLLHKKLNTYSPTRQLFSPLKKEELEEFQKTFDQYLKTIRGSETCHYDAVTKGITMELLGFQPNFTKRDSVTESQTYAADHQIADSTMIVEQESDLASIPESFTTPPPTPEAANHRLNYRELVEQRMKQIGEESREQTHLEQRVAKWHRSLRPRLIAAERRPPFDIHEYGSRIIKTLEVSENKKIPFNHLVEHTSAPEVARYFLASLQLANSYNVAINTTGDSGCCVELELLGKKKNHESSPLALHENIDRISSVVSDDRTMLRISTT